jgi:hypothetical protein
MCEENPTPDKTAGPETKKESLDELNRRVIRDSLFDQLARYPHDTREVDGKQVHDSHAIANERSRLRSQPRREVKMRG